MNCQDPCMSCGQRYHCDLQNAKNNFDFNIAETLFFVFLKNQYLRLGALHFLTLDISTAWRIPRLRTHCEENTCGFFHVDSEDSGEPGWIPILS